MRTMANRGLSCDSNPIPRLGLAQRRNAGCEINDTRCVESLPRSINAYVELQEDGSSPQAEPK